MAQAPNLAEDRRFQSRLGNAKKEQTQYSALAS
jgi:hypothetical protein